MSSVLKMKQGTYIGISPHSSLHIGSVRTFLYVYSFARKNHMPVYLRCDDTNKDRGESSNLEHLIHQLEDFGVEFDYNELHYWNSSIIYQSRNTDIYKQFLSKLVEMDVTSELGGLISLDITKVLGLLGNIRISMADLIKHSTTFNLSACGYKFIPLFSLTKDRFLFHIPCIVDEDLMGISVSIRGEDKIPLVCIHDTLRILLGLRPVQYLHLPILLDRITQKRLRGEQYFIDKILTRFDKNSVLNYLLKSGYRTEKLSFKNLHEFMRDFDHKLIKKSSNYFDENEIK